MFSRLQPESILDRLQVVNSGRWFDEGYQRGSACNAYFAQILAVRENTSEQSSIPPPLFLNLDFLSLQRCHIKQRCQLVGVGPPIS